MSSCNYYGSNLIDCTHPTISEFGHHCISLRCQVVCAFQTSTCKPLVITAFVVVTQCLIPRHTICTVCIYAQRGGRRSCPITRTASSVLYCTTPIKQVDCCTSALIDSDHAKPIWPTPGVRDIFGCILNHSRVVVVIVDHSRSRCISISLSISRSSSNTSREHDKCSQHENIQILAPVHVFPDEAVGLYVHSVEKVMSFDVLRRCVND